MIWDLGLALGEREDDGGISSLIFFVIGRFHRLTECLKISQMINIIVARTNKDETRLVFSSITERLFHSFFSPSISCRTFKRPFHLSVLKRRDGA